MSHSSNVTVSKSVLTAHLDGEAVVFDCSTRTYFRLNESAARIWTGIEAHHSGRALVEHVRDVFDVPSDVVTSEIGRFISESVGRGLLVELDSLQ
jgi:hypothetical protein